MFRKAQKCATMMMGAGILMIGAGPATAADDGDPVVCEADVADVVCQLLGAESLQEFIEDTIELSTPPEDASGVDGSEKRTWVVHLADGRTSHHSEWTETDSHGGTCLYKEVIYERDGVEEGRANSVQCTSIVTGTS